MREITKNDVPYTLLPFLPDWSSRPRFAVVWDTEIEQSLRGYETRGQLRSAPSAELRYAVSFSDATGYAELAAALSHSYRVDHSIAHLPGANAGTAQFAAPWAGRESWLQSWTSDSLTIDATPWPWAVGDWLLAFGDQGGHVVAQVATVAGNVLTLEHLSASLATLALSDGSQVSPIFYGRMDGLKVEVDSPVHTLVPLKLFGGRYELPLGVPPACVDDIEWPVPPSCTPPVAVASVTLVGVVASFAGSSSTPGTSPLDGATPVPLVGYLWQFGDGDEGVGATVEHEYLASGTFTAVLTVRDAIGRYDATTMTVVIEEPADPYGSGGELGGGGI